MTTSLAQERGQEEEGPKSAPYKFYVCKDLKNIFLLFTTSHLRYYMAINVNILILPIFGGEGAFLKGAENGVKGSFCK